MIVGDAEIENAHDVGVVDARDDLVLLQEPVEQAPAAGIGNVAQHLERDSLAALLGLREVNRRQVAGIQLRDEPALARAVQRSVIDEQLARRVEALDAQLAAHDLDEPLMLDAILGEKIGRPRLQRVDGEKLVALRREQQHRRAVVARAQEPQEAEALVRRERDGRAARDRRRRDRASAGAVPPSSADARR